MKVKVAGYGNSKKKTALPRWVRWTLRIVVSALLVMIAGYVALAWYVNTHKEEVLASVTSELNESINGTLEIGGMDPTFLTGFPRVALRLENVALKDSLYATHGKTLLKAGYIDVAVNALALIRGTIEIKKMSISDASLNIYTDATGYSNTTVFKKKKKEEDEGGGSFPELRQMDLENVVVVIDNQKMGKLFNFGIEELESSINYTSDGWEANADLNTMVHSMAFSTNKGSFIKEKRVEGKFDISYSEEDSLIIVQKNRLTIGGEDFRVGARFKTGGTKARFSINIANKSILWRNAANLLSPNITRKLEMFGLKKPIAVKCDLIGDLNEKGDPLIRVNAEVDNNTLDTPGGVVNNCSFFGVFTNDHVAGKGYNDANSAIKLYNFKGDYSGIPILMKKVFILDLEKPIAVGNLTSNFKMEELRGIIDDDLLKFTKGTADVKLDFRADIVNFKLSKPLVNGVIAIKDADVSYVPRKLNFRDVSVALDFTKDDLNISEIVLKSGKSIVNMKGSIKNFLNLYYTDPEKIVLTWDIYSPQLHLGEFMGFLGSRQRTRAVVKKTEKGNMTEDLNLLFERSNVDMKLRVDKLYYNKFAATDARADVLLTENGVVVKNAGLKHGGGSLVINGMLAQSGKVNQYSLDAVISNVDINKFFHAFNNFGMETLSAQNLKGYVSSKANIRGSITNAGAMVPKSMYGTVAFALKKGMLVNFEPLKSVGSIAFPNRDINNIEFYDLNGRFDVKGEKVTIHPMKINSSVLNMDVQGVYSFGKGTQIYIDVPLRNPKRDKNITDKKELAERRNRGIVVHLKAVDDKDGKVKVKLGGKKDK